MTINYKEPYTDAGGNVWFSDRVAMVAPGQCFCCQRTTTRCAIDYQKMLCKQCFPAYEKTYWLGIWAAQDVIKDMDA